jgi:hypothetical protein
MASKPTEAVQIGIALENPPAIESASSTQLGVPKGTYRVIVASKAAGAIGKLKRGSDVIDVPFISRPYAHVAAHLGMKVQDAGALRYEVTKSGAKAPEDGSIIVRLKGSQRAGSIQVPMMKTATEIETSESGSRRMLSIPVPSWATIDNIFAFLKDVVAANKPKYFISKDGEQYPLSW